MFVFLVYFIVSFNRRFVQNNFNGLPAVVPVYVSVLVGAGRLGFLNPLG